jgi:hypothetical protein
MEPDDLSMSPEDQALLAELHAMLNSAPERVIDQGFGAYAWRRVDEELAALSDEPGLVGVRSAGPMESITFAAGELVVEIEVRVNGGGRSVIGQIVPADALTLTADGPDQPGVSAFTNQFGMFELNGLRAGPFRLRISGDAGTRLTTDWLLL